MRKPKYENKMVTPKTDNKVKVWLKLENKTDGPFNSVADALRHASNCAYKAHGIKFTVIDNMAAQVVEEQEPEMEAVTTSDMVKEVELTVVNELYDEVG